MGAALKYDPSVRRRCFLITGGNPLKEAIRYFKNKDAIQKARAVFCERNNVRRLHERWGGVMAVSFNDTTPRKGWNTMGDGTLHPGRSYPNLRTQMGVELLDVLHSLNFSRPNEFNWSIKFDFFLDGDVVQSTVLLRIPDGTGEPKYYVIVPETDFYHYRPVKALREVGSLGFHKTVGRMPEGFSGAQHG